MGWRLESEGTRVYLWLVPADVWQRPSRYYKAIIFQLKKKRIAPGLGWLWVLTPRWTPRGCLGEGTQPRGSRLYCGACVTGDEGPGLQETQAPCHSE